MYEFTKGEWGVKHSESKTAFNIVGTVLGGKYKIARCPYTQIEGAPNFNKNDKNEAEANAKLIAAAPKMFEMLKESLSILEWFMENTTHKDGDTESFFNIGANQIEQTKQLLTEITK